jgi:stearoyl-CoA desaturase (delta-9 desaturase)
MTTLLDGPGATPPPGGGTAVLDPEVERLAEPRVQSIWEHLAMLGFVIIPFLALIAGVIYAAQGNAIGWLNVGLAVFFYALSGHGVTVGFHRYFTHGAFKARRPVRIALAVAGSMAVEGPIIRWVSDHRRHHAFSDKPGDPHSPWKYGTGWWSMLKGLFWAHLGWLFDTEHTDPARFAPDILEDKDLVRVHRLFPYLTATTLFAPAALGWLLTGFTWHGAWTAFLWAGLVRIFFLHHVTWSINSLCHVVGKRPFMTRDHSANVWPLGLISMGESWHNLHHAEPTSARHGVDRGQIDTSAEIIRVMEKLGWVSDVRWPDRARLDKRRVAPAA